MSKPKTPERARLDKLVGPLESMSDEEALDLASRWQAETIADLEQKLDAMVDERLASLARRLDLLYRYTVGDRTGRHTLVPNMHQRGAEFPEAEP